MGQTLGSDIDITAVERHLIRKSYTCLRGRTADFSEVLFTNTFVASPSFARRFSFTAGSPKFEMHVEKFITGVSILVNCLREDTRDVKLIKRLLDENARLHARFNIGYEDFEVLQSALLKTLKMTLRRSFTREMEEAWSKGLKITFTYIWNRMLHIKSRK